MSDQPCHDEASINERVEAFLKRLEVNYGKTVLEGRQVFGVPWAIHEKEFLVMIQVQDGWVWLCSAILLAPDHPVEQYSEFLMECLRANHVFPEISYDVDEHGTLGTSREVELAVMASDIGFSQFKQAFFSIPATIKHFIENIASKHRVQVPGFHEMVKSFIKRVQE